MSLGPRDGIHSRAVPVFEITWQPSPPLADCTTARSKDDCMIRVMC